MKSMSIYGWENGLEANAKNYRMKMKMLQVGIAAGKWKGQRLEKAKRYESWLRHKLGVKTEAAARARARKKTKSSQKKAA